MATFSAERPQFFEGQYLGADDLESIVEYLRVTSARQNLGHHSWGVVAGLNLVSQSISDTAVEYYIQPGVAIDGYGRIIIVNNPARIETEQFVSIGSGNVDVWIRYDESEFEATREGFNACSAKDEYARIKETYKIEVGNKTNILDHQSGVSVDDKFVVDAREALISVDSEAEILCDGSVPYQSLPVENDNFIWLIPLGHVKWSSASNSFLPLIDPAEQEALESGAGGKTPEQVYESMMSGRTKRRLAGAIAESVFAADGVIRLRERTVPLDPAKETNTICNLLKIQSEDLQVCEGKVKPKELIWLEGDTRLKGDARLFNGRLEFKDKDGKDYVERTVDGHTVSAITPLIMQRLDVNARGGSDLQVMLGKSDDGINRLTIGNILFDGKDLCNLSISSENKIVFQDNGRLGIGTVNPDTNLESPYTVRSFKEEVIENEDAENENKYNIFRLETYQSDEGKNQWQMDLWEKEGTVRKSLNFTESDLVKSRFFLETGGNVGVGTTEPKEQFHVYGDDPAIFIDIDESSGLEKTELKFGSDGDTHASVYWSKDSQKLFFNHDGVDSIVVNKNKVGLGTSRPKTTLHIATGTDVKLGDNTGYLLLGDVDNKNIAMDDNEVQARNDGDPSILLLQKEGGDFSVHLGNDSEFRIKDNGRVGIGTSNPDVKLEVRGNIKMGSSGNLFAMSSVEQLRTIVGRVTATGGESQGAGYAVSRSSTGTYNITFDTPFSSYPIVVANSYGNNDNILSVHNLTSASCQIHVTDIRSTFEDPLDTTRTELENRAFTFIAIGER